jgi:hypothetical protein
MTRRSRDNSIPDRKPAFQRLFDLVAMIAARLDRTFGWANLPLPLGVMTLFGLRQRLRERNLYPVDAGLPPPTAQELTEARLSVNTYARTLDGRFNDFVDPDMGAACTRFGRNSPAVRPTFRDDPLPEVVSDRLLLRRVFQPAPQLNLLAAAWVQFEVHDWISHLTVADRPLRVGQHDVSRLWRDPRVEAPPFYINGETHWWDGSQLYGSDRQFAADVRDDGGKLKVDDALLEAIERFAIRDDNVPTGCPVSPRGLANLWIGLALLHILFAREHNAICERLRKRHRSWDDDRLFAQARLINTALMAKIHTTEWTPAMIAHPTTQFAIRATWWGLLGRRFRTRVGRIGQGEILSGIPGSATALDGVPYSLTEEFVAVYRMHPLLPDEVAFYCARNEQPLDKTFGFMELAMGKDKPGQPREVIDDIGQANAFYSLGIANPGALTLHNYPRFFHPLTRVNGDEFDLAAVDIMRMRECEVARYNNFRRFFRMRPARSFYDLAGSNELATEISDVYRGDIEAVDLMVGLFAERKPPGFAFSDTAFRVFLLMAARRLTSDRFFTTDFTPEVYTDVGLEWIAKTTFADMLRRHYPDLTPVLDGADNAFLPWGPPPR